MAVIYSYCLYVVLFVFQRLKQGLSETLHTRLSTVRRAQAYVLGYCLYWMLPLVLSFVDFVFENSSHGTLRTLTAFFLAIRGLFSAFILLSPNWTEMKSFLDATRTSGGTDGLVQNVVEEDLSLRPHLNTALRAEIIFFTTQVSRPIFASDLICMCRVFDLLLVKRRVIFNPKMSEANHCEKIVEPLNLQPQRFLLMRFVTDHRYRILILSVSRAPAQVTQRRSGPFSAMICRELRRILLQTPLSITSRRPSKTCLAWKHHRLSPSLLSTSSFFFFYASLKERKPL